MEKTEEKEVCETWHHKKVTRKKRRGSENTDILTLSTIYCTESRLKYLKDVSFNMDVEFKSAVSM